jgi:ADP-heptose:LPS heptosyltransferase
MKPRPAVVILRALGLGDFLTGVPAYRALRATFADHEIVLAAPGVLAPGELQPIRWPGARPSVAVDLHGNGPASHRLVRALRAESTMMYASPADPHVTGPWWDDREHEVSRWCRLVEWWGVPADRSALGLAPPPPGPWPARAVVVHPGAASGSRRWPPERFATVARELAASGLTPIITGTRQERPLALRVAVAAGLGRQAVAAGRTTLSDLAGLVATARLVISNDTGVAHLAVAFGTPSVTLFGPVSPALWGPPAAARCHLALWKGAAFRPGNPHGDVPDPRLLRITVDEVLAAAASLKPTAASRSAHVPARR